MGYLLFPAALPEVACRTITPPGALRGTARRVARHFERLLSEHRAHRRARGDGPGFWLRPGSRDRFNHGGLRLAFGRKRKHLGEPGVRDIETIDGELRLLARAWRVARHLGCTPSAVLIDQLLDERAATTRCGFIRFVSIAVALRRDRSKRR